MDKIAISLFDKAADNKPRNAKLSFDEFAQLLTTPRALGVEAEQYFSMPKKARAEIKKKLSAWSPAVYPSDAKRDKDNVEHLSCIALDVDAQATSFEHVAKRMKELRLTGVVHTTISDGGASAGVRSLRVVVFVDRPIKPNEYAAARDECARQLGILIDPSTATDTSRIFFLPAQLHGGPFESQRIDGDPVKAGELLACAYAAQRLAEDSKRKAAAPERKKKLQRAAERKRNAAATAALNAARSAEWQRFKSAVDFLTRHRRKEGQTWPGTSGAELPEGRECALGGLAFAYEDWRRVGCAIKDADDGDEGFNLFDMFSRAAASKFDAEGVRKTWAGIDNASGGITADWVYKVALTWGWEDPAPLVGRIDEAALANRLATSWKDRFVVLSGAKLKGTALLYKDELGIWRCDERKARATAEYLELIEQLEAEGRKPEELHKLRNRRAIDNVIDLAEREVTARKLAEFDADACVLGVQNGVLDIAGRRLLSADEITQRGPVSKQCGAAWDEAAECPKWREHVLFMAGGDVEIAAYIQELVGSALWGGHARRNMVLGVGPGRNGKSVFLRHLMKAMGDYAGPLDRGALMHKGAGDAGFKLATLAGKRLVAVSETESGETLSAATVKQLLGGDLVQIRGFMAPPSEMAAQFTLLLFSNSRPRIRDQSEGLWEDRLRLIPLTAKFSGDVSQSTVDTWLDAERNGILRWAVEGFTRFAARGYKFDVPARVLAETEEYRRDVDVIGQWIADCAVVGEGLQEAGRKLHASYVDWAGQQGDKYVLNQRDFFQALHEKGYERKKTAKARLYLGIALHPDAESGATRAQREIEHGAAARALSVVKAA